MKDYHSDFSLDPQHIWLNVASEGPLPKCAALALQEAIVLKSSPHLLTIPKFHQVPLLLKESIGKLIGVPAGEIILGNSASYGIHLLANGIQLKAGDEVLLMQNDFPTNILPWLSLEKKGVIIRQLKPQSNVLSVDEIKAAISPRLRVICLSHIHSFSGWGIDAAAIGKIANGYGILYIVNVSQSAGAMPLDMGQLNADAVVCAGYKWLLGPYGTGFIWIKSRVRETLDYPQNYWISLMNEASLSGEGALTLNDEHSARRYDVFGTANFFNYMPWRASIEYLLSIGIRQVHEHNQGLVLGLNKRLLEKGYQLISPVKQEDLANIVVFSDKDGSKNKAIHQHLGDKGIHLALWKNKLRVSPHIYNSMDDINQLLKEL